MPTCPNGHQSGSDDWCEVCGHRMAGAVPPPPPPPPPGGGGYGFPPPPGAPGQPGGHPGGQPGGRPHLSAVPDHEPELCPQCRTPREGGAPFCEECRWNFLTNTATSYTPAAPRPQAPGPGLPSHFQQGPPPGPPPGPSYGGGDSYEYQGSRPSQVNRPAEPIPPFGSEPSGPSGQGGPPSGFPGDPSRPPGGPGAPGGPGPSGFPGDPSRPNFGADPSHPGQQPGQQPGPSGFPGDPSGFPGNPSRPGPPGQPGQPNFGDPSRPVPPPPGPTPQAGPGHGPGPGATSGGPQAFQQQGAPAYPQERQQPGGPSFGGGTDDWVISPPSSTAPGGPGGGPGGPGGGYGYPQQGSTQAPPAPPGPSFQQGPATWIATIGPDRDYFMAMMQRSGPEAAGLNLPAYSPEQQRTLTGNQVTIGRRRHSTGDTPDVDLSVPPEDPGVSHQHAVLVQQPDGSWAVVDQNSTNGTTVNGGEEPIQPFVPVPLQDGDRVHVGAWTTITVRRG
ncbi:FHA domain-containing protein [Streptomyces fulvoviolaceus]|uniref:FHA domain-containing protein n=1 Tax=Streptomyces fulvoviolaceus TaxID=285535 RepID=UPI0021C00BCD|nr:FHA domain-containing protein [Streptomyces fulvoviolaceus]MCT9078568.1 FHA domain-containing protein [Streptomyces fulvoviolaceus]